MAIYSDTTLTEQPIYGSSRLGQYKGQVKAGHRTLGRSNYELSNHFASPAVAAVKVPWLVGSEGGATS